MVLGTTVIIAVFVTIHPTIPAGYLSLSFLDPRCISKRNTHTLNFSSFGCPNAPSRTAGVLQLPVLYDMLRAQRLLRDATSVRVQSFLTHFFSFSLFELDRLFFFHLIFSIFLLFVCWRRYRIWDLCCFIGHLRTKKFMTKLGYIGTTVAIWPCWMRAGWFEWFLPWQPNGLAMHSGIVGGNINEH